jgi:hypothetical protein
LRRGRRAAPYQQGERERAAGQAKMFGRDPWGGPLEISNADSATDDDRSRDLDRAALMRQLDETQQSWLLAGPGDQAGKKKKRYVDLGCVVVDRKIFMWTVGTILGVGLFIGFVMMIVKLVPHKKPPPPPPDQYTQALHKALMFFNAQRCEFFFIFPITTLQLQLLPLSAPLTEFRDPVLRA